MAGRLEGRIALTTGFGRDIGHATARFFARQSAAVVVTDMREKNGRAAEELATYGVAKAGVTRLMCNTAQEYGPLGVRANAICPGLSVLGRDR